MTTAETTLPPSKLNVSDERPIGQGYWNLVWGQFKKNRTALVSLVIIVLLLLAGAWAPVIAHGRPFIWVEDGKTTYPLFQYLVAPRDRMSVDHLFNYFIFLSITLPLILIPTVKWGIPTHLPERLRSLRIKLAISAAFLVALIPFISPAHFDRAATPKEQEALIAAGAEQTTIIHDFAFFRRYVLERPKEHSNLVASRGDYAIFPLVPFDPEPPTPEILEGPSQKHWLGTDAQGRDVTSRMFHGGRISMSVGFVSISIATILGILIGGLAGYYRGWVDIVISRCIELMICFPTFFLIITIIAFIEERSIFHIMLIMGLTGWTGIARLVRGEFLKLSDQDFVTSARALGCDGRRIMFRHILPNAMGPVLVSVAFGVAGAVLTETSLSFLGFGAPPPTATWGEMISQGKQNLDEAWWLMLFPGLSIFITVTVYNLVGDGLRDAMDPKMRK